MTRNGSGTKWVSWPIVTCRSCITSSSADCTLAGARLISSASRKLQKTGPSSVSKLPVSGREMRGPTRADGTGAGGGRREGGGELDALEGAAEDGGRGLDRERLGEAGHALDQQVATGEQAD